MNSYCSHCNKQVPIRKSGFGRIGGLSGNARYTCTQCGSDVKVKSKFFFFSLTILILFLSLSLASAISITPFSSNLLNGTTVNTRYVNLGWNITSVNPLDTIIFNWNNTKYSLYDNSLLGYYNFDNNSAVGENGNKVVDISKFSNNATIYGPLNISQVNGKYDKAYSFNSINNSVIIINNTLALNFTIGQPFTVSAWFKASHFYMTSGNDILVEKWAQNNNGYAFAFRIVNDSTRGKLTFLTWNGTTGTGISSTTYVNDSQWHHFAGVSNGTSIFLYIDGNKEAENALVEKGFGSYGSNDIGIGARGTGWQSKMNGSIDNLVIFNRTLNPNEIKLLYQSSITKNDFNNYSLTSNYSIIGINSNIDIITNDTSNNFDIKSMNIKLKYNLNVLSNTIGIIRPDFYGANTHNPNYLIAGAYLDETNALWLRNNWLSSGMKVQRIDGQLNNYYSNVSTNGYNNWINFTDSSPNLSLKKQMIDFAKANNQKVLLILDKTPSFLGDNSSGMCLNINYCPPTNATILGKIFMDFYTRLGCTYDVCDVEIWNEPYSDVFFMGKLGYDNVTKALNYTKMYNGVREAIYKNDSRIKVGGPSGFRLAPNFMTTFLTNVTLQNRSFITTHPYGYTLNNELSQYNDVKDLYDKCTSLGVSCGSDIRLTEWNVGTAELQNLTYGSNRFGMSVSQSYTSLLNYLPANISSIFYQYTELFAYASNYPEYPKKWAMVSAPKYDNSIAPSYSVTANYTRYASAGSTVHNCTTDNSEVQCVATITSSGTCSITLTNTINDYQNVSNSFISSCGNNLIDTSNGNLISNGSTIVLNAYDVRSLTTPYEAYTPTGWIWTNYLGERVGTMSEDDVQNNVPLVRQTNMCTSFSSQWQTFFLWLGVIVVVLFSVFILGMMISSGANFQELTNAIITIVIVSILLIIPLSIILSVCGS